MSKGKSLDEELESTQQNVEQLNKLMIGIVIVLLIGFVGAFIAVGGMIVSNEADNKATYQNLVNQVHAQNAQVQVLTNQLENSTVTQK